MKAMWKIIARLLALLVFVGFVSPAHAARLHDGERRIVLNGVEHWVRIAGAKAGTTPLIIVHGGPGGNVYTYERTIGPQLERFTTVVYYDQRGSGRSAAPANPSDYTMPTIVADLDSLRVALGAERINLLGFSFGGLIAMEYAVRHPERVDRLILQSAPDGDYRRLAAIQTWGFEALATGKRREQIRALAAQPVGSPMQRMNAVWALADREAVDRFLFHNQNAATLNRRLWEQSGLSNSGRMAAVVFADENARATPLVDELNRITARTLVLVGRHDRNVGLDIERDLADRIPNATLSILENSAHFPEMEEPHAYAATVRAFLKRR
jgi:proline iminopeptidase